MASSLFKFEPKSKVAGVVDLYVTVLFGAASITSQVGVYATVVRTGVGLYRVDLGGPFNSLLMFRGAIMAAAVAGTTFEVISVANVNAASPSFTFRAVNTAGAEADVASGNSAMFQFKMRNSAQPLKGG